MKKLKIVFLSLVSSIICLQLIGYFNLINVYASENLDPNLDQLSSQTLESNQTNPSDAQEEGAAGILDNQNPSSDPLDSPSSQQNQAVESSKQVEMPEIRSNPISKKKVSQLTSVTIAPTAEVVINEVMANPEGTDAGNEWVEIYNNGGSSVDISGWSVRDLAGYTYYVVGNVTLPSQGFYVITNVSNLNNTGPETVDLLDANLNQIDHFSYNGATQDVVRGRYPDGSSNFIQLGYPTPGSANYLKPEAGVVNDGLTFGVDADYSNDESLLSANWSDFSDRLFPIDHYEYAFGTTAGTSDITGGWLTTDELSATFSVSLVENHIYYASVRAVNSKGIKSDISSSDGVTIDITAPVNYDYIIVSEDGSPITVGSQVYIEIQPGEADLSIDGYFNSEKLVWTMAIDQLKHGPFYYAIYKVDQNDLQTKNAQLEFNLTDQAGNISQAYQFDSNVEIDTIAPAAPISISVISGANNIKISWLGSASNDTIGYNIYRSSSPYIKLNQELLPVNQANFTDYNVKENITYHYKITAVDLAGNETELNDSLSSRAIEITSIAKVVGQILDNGLKTYQPQSISFIQNHQVKGKVKGEKAVKADSEKETETKAPEEATNWPMIIALIVAGLIILSGVWYYWAVTRNNEEISSRSRNKTYPKKRLARTARSRRTNSARGKTVRRNRSRRVR